MTKSVLAPYRDLSEIKMDELVHLAAEIVPKVAGPQEGHHRVTAIPDARTIRFYIREGLVDRPHGSEGPAALYGYRHLLQLLAIKVLQSRFLPIRKIRETLHGLSDRELEDRLEAWVRAAPVSPALDSARAYLESLAQGDENAATRLPDRIRSWRVAPSAPEPLASLSYDPARLSEPPRTRSVRPRESSPAADREEGWSRFELYPGIELHVRRDVAVPESPSFLSALASRLRAILEKVTRRSP